ncbi:hypothetical protein DL93DRAFT_2226210 [Clavulina sp. PMI_390]|nr:hypothetical protein DL93DRAFT_2226210 [Clavulina sp. PMI_390]
MEPPSPPWNESTRASPEAHYGTVVWQSTQNPQKFMDSMISKIASGSSGVKRSASDPLYRPSKQPKSSALRRNSEHSTASTSSTISQPVGSMRAADFGDSVKKRPRRSVLAVHDPANLSSEMDVDELAGLVHDVAQSLHDKPTPTPSSSKRSLARTPSSQRIRSTTAERQPRHATSTRSIETSRPIAKPHSSKMVQSGSPQPIIKPPARPRAGPIDIEVTPPPKTTRSINQSHPAGGSHKSSIACKTNQLLNGVPSRAPAIVEPPPAKPPVSPLMKKFGTSAAASPVLGARNRSLGMKGTLKLNAASKPFKAPLPATSKRGNPNPPNHNPQPPIAPLSRRPASPPPEPLDGIGDLSSDSYDVPFDLDRDLVEAELSQHDRDASRRC